MGSLITYYLNHLILILAAPFYFHFGQYAFVTDFVAILFEISDIIGLYFLQISILLTLVYYRNTVLKTLTTLNFRYSLVNKNRQFLLNFFKNSLISFKNLFNRIKNFF